MLNKDLVPGGNTGNPIKSDGDFKWLPHSVGGYGASFNSSSIIALTPLYIS